MHPDSKLRTYTPRAEHIRLVVTPTSWAVYLSPRANVIDLAIVMNGLRVRCEAKRATITEGLLVVPVDPTTPAPAPDEFALVIAKGFDARNLPDPIMFKRQAC